MKESQIKILKVLKVAASMYKAEFGGKLPITGELGELYVCKLMNLIKMTSNNPGFDAVDEKGTKYQIKSAVLLQGIDTRGTTRNPEANTFFHAIKDSEYDIMVFCVLGSNFELLQVWKINKKDLFNCTAITSKNIFKKTKRITLNVINKTCILVYKI